MFPYFKTASCLATWLYLMEKAKQLSRLYCLPPPAQGAVSGSSCEDQHEEPTSAPVFGTRHSVHLRHSRSFIHASLMISYPIQEIAWISYPAPICQMWFLRSSVVVFVKNIDYSKVWHLMILKLVLDLLKLKTLQSLAFIKLFILIISPASSKSHF